MKLAIQFGAGAIGRGLLGKVLHDSDYHVLFVDVYQPIVDRINEDGYYMVELSDHDFESQKIDNVSALCSTSEEDLEKIYEKITQAEIITTSVRVENLDSTSKIIAKGLEQKYPDDKKVNIMAFENAYRASDILKEDIIKNSSLSAEQIEEIATFPNTVTDRIVQNKEVDGKPVVEISDDFEAVIEQTKLDDPTSKPVKDAEYTDDIDKMLERKLFLVNGAHAATSYFGYNKGYKMMNEAFEDEKILADVQNLMTESGNVLIKEHGLDKDELENFKESKLNRFLKTASHDTIERVGRDPVRKLGENDRLVAPAIKAFDNDMPFDNLAKAIAYAFKYDEQSDDKAGEIIQFVNQNSIESAIEKYTGIKEEERKELFDKIVSEYQNIN
ncbi:aspartate carbamoyltransferase [Anaerococcus sp. mt242]|uniref:mannitol dehydrogenase family protein n=1 Tax=Anaerococcus sp. mt242 TaxID=2661917 RepID=UPI001933A56A|nr:aspartate carbamoyltransferase [Anaerococcus sp. mt242]MBM0047106.1 aspartate carbamoyltransferase [Anaerococcus sp. mt242]